MRIRERFALLFVATIALAGCAASPPGPTDGPTPSTSTPVSEPRVATIEVSTTGLRFLDETGTELATRGYFDDPEATIDLLSDVFGTEPEPVPYPGHIEARPGTDYTWADFVFRVQDFESDPPMWSNVTVLVGARLIGDVEVRTPSGFSVGSSVEEIVATGIEPGEQFPGSSGRMEFWLMTEPTEVDDDDPGFESLNYVALRADVEDGVIVELAAPFANYGV